MAKLIAVVTGASSGIGRAAASRLVDLGYEVIGTSRNPKIIKDPVKGVQYEQLDLSSEESVDLFAQKLTQVDVLINNAGQSQLGPAEEIPMEKIRSLFEIDFFGLVRLTRAVLPGMRERKSGIIISTSSMSGVIGVSFTPYYCAVKFALEGFSESLRKEMYPFNVRVVLVEPGYIKTGIFQDQLFSSESPYYPYLKKFKAVRDHHIKTGASADDVAKKMMQIIQKKNPKIRYAAGGDAPRNAFLTRLLPSKWVETFQRRKFDIV